MHPESCICCTKSLRNVLSRSITNQVCGAGTPSTGTMLTRDAYPLPNSNISKRTVEVPIFPVYNHSSTLSFQIFTMSVARHSDMIDDYSQFNAIMH